MAPRVRLGSGENARQYLFSRYCFIVRLLPLLAGRRISANAKPRLFYRSLREQMAF